MLRSCRSVDSQDDSLSTSSNLEEMFLGNENKRSVLSIYFAICQNQLMPKFAFK